MNIEQCSQIIADIFHAEWPVTKSWNAYHIRKILYPKVRHFDEPVARAAAEVLAGTKKFKPTAEEWAIQCRVQSGDAKENVVRVDCPDCGGSGLLAFAARRFERGGFDETELRHWLDCPAGAGWHTYAVACGCENSGQTQRNERLARAAKRAVRDWEEAQGWSDNPASPEDWQGIMDRVRALGASKAVGATLDSGDAYANAVRQKAAMAAGKQAALNAALQGSEDW